MYAVIKTGGKQYRVSEGEHLLVERLPEPEGATVDLHMLRVDGDSLLDGDELAKLTAQAQIVAHERGPKLRIVKFKPKRGYYKRNGHRQDLTRIQITTLGRTGAKSGSPRRAAAPTETQTEVADGA